MADFGLSPVVAGVARTICCHRATLSGALAPNSLAAVEECVDAAVPRIEIDVRFLQDDGILVFHDPSLDAETTGSGRVDALDTAAARLLRYRDGDGLPLCFIDDVVAVVKRGTSLLQVDLKLMRPIAPARLAALADALTPIRDQVLLGSQAHWNLRGFHHRGFRVALDPTLQWHYAPGRDPGLSPASLGLHGFWDDSPLARIRHASTTDYFDARVSDLVGLLPGAVEWMVDARTIARMGALGFSLGRELHRRGIELAAWTLRDRGPVETSAVLSELFSLGVDTIIADDAPTIGRYAQELGL